MKQFLLIFSLLGAFFFASCSPERRLANLLKKHPQLVKTDTVFRHDTIIIPGSTVDTTFIHHITKDTIIIRENNTTVKYFNDGKTVYLQGKTDTTTIIKEVPVVIHSVEAKPESRGEMFWRKAKDIFTLLLLGAIIVLIILQKNKNHSA